MAIKSVKLCFKQPGIRAGGWGHRDTVTRIMLLHGYGKVGLTWSWGGNIRARKEAVWKTSKYIGKKVILLVELLYNRRCLGEWFVLVSSWEQDRSPELSAPISVGFGPLCTWYVSQCFNLWALT